MTKFEAVLAVDVERAPVEGAVQISSRRFAVRSRPTIVVTANGRMIVVSVGPLEKVALLALWQAALVELSSLIDGGTGREDFAGNAMTGTQRTFVRRPTDVLVREAGGRVGMVVIRRIGVETVGAGGSQIRRCTTVLVFGERVGAVVIDRSVVKVKGRRSFRWRLLQRRRRRRRRVVLAS